MIVVVGATGNVGRPLVTLLAAAGQAVTAVSRGGGSPLPGHPLVAPVSADLERPSDVRRAADGATSMFLVVPGAGGGLDAGGIVGAAAEAGVKRLVLLSSQAVGTRPGSAVYAPMGALEGEVRESGLVWTLLRPSGFHTNAFAWLASVRAERSVHAPFGDVALPSVDPLDLAEVAAVVLTQDGHGERTYELTGPEATTPRQRTEALAAALGTPLTFDELAAQEARAQMLETMPEPVVDGTLAILGRPTTREQAVSPDVESVLGRPGRTFADWARRHARAFAER